MKPTKIIHVLTDKNFGGAGRWLINYLTYHDKKSFHVKVLLPKGSVLIDRVKALGIEVIQMESMRDKSLDIKALKALKTVLKEEKPDVLHTHASLTARIAGTLTGVHKIIHTKHCLETPSTGLKKSIKLLINKKLSHKIIACSNAVKDQLIASGLSEQQVELIYNGVVPLRELDQPLKIKLREDFKIPLGHLVVGQIGRLEKIKGSDVFVDAAIAIAKSKENVTFLVVGTGSLEQELKDKVQSAHMEDRIIFTGYQENMEEMFNMVDINVMSSRSEALCLSLIEGMCLGIPSVGTDTGGIVEVIIDGKTGSIVPVEDKKKLGQAIKELLEDEALRIRYGQQGKIHMHETFLASKMAKEVEVLYLS